jgi:hypothetical protein
MMWTGKEGSVSVKEIQNAQVRAVFEQYPAAAQKKMLQLRQHILDCAAESDQSVEESLKWGEPSYRCKSGSPVRLGVRETPALTLCLFFNCQSTLVDTFRELYGNELRFEGNRAILLPAQKKIPAVAITDCITLALEYHRRKHLPLLGA